MDPSSGSHLPMRATFSRKGRRKKEKRLVFFKLRRN
jgi:hypothetical protein